jgi:hypothetical protein
VRTLTFRFSQTWLGRNPSENDFGELPKRVEVCLQDSLRETLNNSQINQGQYLQRKSQSVNEAALVI